MSIEEILNIDPYSHGKETKHKLLNKRLQALMRLHYEACEPYRKMMDAV